MNGVQAAVRPLLAVVLLLGSVGAAAAQADGAKHPRQAAHEDFPGSKHVCQDGCQHSGKGPANDPGFYTRRPAEPLTAEVVGAVVAGLVMVGFGALLLRRRARTAATTGQP